MSLNLASLALQSEVALKEVLLAADMEEAGSLVQVPAAVLVARSSSPTFVSPISFWPAYRMMQI